MLTIIQRAGEYVIEWGQELEKQYKAQDHGSAYGNKRSTNASADEPPSKRAKVNSTSANDEDMRSAWEANALDKLKVADLKAWLTSRKLSTSGLKADLVARVEQHFETKA